MDALFRGTVMSQPMRDELTPRFPAGRPMRVLVVEDETLISMFIENVVCGLGHEAACAYNVSDALRLVARMTPVINAAMLDVNLGGAAVFPVAEALSRRGIPFVFLTGYGRSGVPDCYAETLVMQKPFSEDDIAFTLAGLRNACSERAATRQQSKGSAMFPPPGATVVAGQA